MYADLRMIPHESALFSSACKPTSLGVVSGQVTAKASASQVPWLALCVWLQKGVREDMAWSKHIDLYAFSRGSFRKKARNLIETAQRKSQHIAPMLVHMQPASHGGHYEQYSPFQSAMCKRWDTPEE